MKQFIVELFSLFDRQDKQKFFVLILVLFTSACLGLLGIGTVIPFIHVLLDPNQLETVPLLNRFTYQQAVTILVIALIAAFWIKNVASYVSLLIQSKILYGIYSKIAKKLFVMYMSAPYYWHLQRSTPELIRNINNEANLFATHIIQPFGNFITELIAAVVVFGVLLYINLVFSLIVGVTLGITLMFFVRFTRAKAKHYSTQRAEAWLEMTKQVMQGLSGIKETKVYQRESFFIDFFNQAADKTGHSAAFANIFQQTSRFLIEATSIAVILLMILVFILLGYSGQSLFILMVVFGVASIQLLPCVNRLTQAYSQMKYGRLALSTMYNELINGKKESMEFFSPVDKNNSPQILQLNKELVLEDINFSYNRLKTAIVNLNLKIKKGQSVAFVGQSGAGKTTLIDLIMGLHKPLSGEILVDNVKLTEANLSAWRKHFGYIPQQIYLYDSSIRENVAVGIAKKDIDDSAVWAALSNAGIKSFVEQLPEQLDTKVGENGIRLSGGQRQRIGIARALYHNPDILIMDEATAALDNQTEQEVTEALNSLSLSKQRTLITIAHRLSTIRHCDNIFVLNQGCLVSQGTYNELRDTCSIFSKMVHLAEGRTTNV